VQRLCRRQPPHAHSAAPRPAAGALIAPGTQGLGMLSSVGSAVTTPLPPVLVLGGSQVVTLAVGQTYERCARPACAWPRTHADEGTPTCRCPPSAGTNFVCEHGPISATDSVDGNILTSVLLCNNFFALVRAAERQPATLRQQLGRLCLSRT
jgi:hypothetical protein